MRRAAFALALLAAPAPAASPEEARWAIHARAVTITRDDWGIAHVRGKTDADAVFGMIYAQAEDDFPRIEANYLTALGRMAERDGETAIWADLRARLWNDPAELKRDYDRSPGYLRRLMDAWADGLNFWLARHPGRARVLTRFEPWMALSFTEGSIGGDVERVPLSQLEAFYGRREVAWTALERGRAEREPGGSNGIAIGPTLSADGHPLLLINPHTSFHFRSEAQVASGEGLNAYGAATWGQFFVYQGFNAHAGWMHTTSGADAVDEFAETIVRRNGRLFYRYGTGERPVERRAVELSYRGPGNTLLRVAFVTFRTHHGPITRAEGGRWIATALMHRPVAALEQSFGRTKARSWAEFERVSARGQANSSNNTVFADRFGTVAFQLPQFMPRRDDRFDYGRPVDGSDPATDWRGLHAPSELPTVVNPRLGWIQNTNDHPWTAAGPDSPVRTRYPKYMDAAGENPRGLHVLALLEPARRVTLPGLIAMAYDPALPAFDLLLPSLFAAHDALPAADPRRARLAGPVADLRRWDRRWSAGSTATTLAVYWGEAMQAATARPDPPAGLARYDLIRDASAAAQLAALETAVARLRTDFGSAAVPWGEVNRFQRLTGDPVQPFSDAQPSIPVPFASAVWGSLASFGAAPRPWLKRRYGTLGNSFVAAVEFGPRVRARAVSAGGQSGDPRSRHFNDQAARYAAGDLRPVYFHPDELNGHVERVYRPGD